MFNYGAGTSAFSNQSCSETKELFNSGMAMGAPAPSIDLSDPTAFDLEGIAGMYDIDMSTTDTTFNSRGYATTDTEETEISFLQQSPASRSTGTGTRTGAVRSKNMPVPLLQRGHNLLRKKHMSPSAILSSLRSTSSTVASSVRTHQRNFKEVKSTRSTTSIDSDRSLAARIPYLARARQRQQQQQQQKQKQRQHTTTTAATKNARQLLKQRLAQSRRELGNNTTSTTTGTDHDDGDSTGTGTSRISGLPTFQRTQEPINTFSSDSSWNVEDEIRLQRLTQELRPATHQHHHQQAPLLVEQRDGDDTITTEGSRQHMLRGVFSELTLDEDATLGSTEIHPTSTGTGTRTIQTKLATMTNGRYFPGINTGSTQASHRSQATSNIPTTSKSPLVNPFNNKVKPKMTFSLRPYENSPRSTGSQRFATPQTHNRSARKQQVNEGQGQGQGQGGDTKHSASTRHYPPPVAHTFESRHRLPPTRQDPPSNNAASRLRLKSNTKQHPPARRDSPQKAYSSTINSRNNHKPSDERPPPSSRDPSPAELSHLISNRLNQLTRLYQERKRVNKERATGSVATRSSAGSYAYTEGTRNKQTEESTRDHSDVSHISAKNNATRKKRQVHVEEASEVVEIIRVPSVATHLSDLPDSPASDYKVEQVTQQEQEYPDDVDDAESNGVWPKGRGGSEEGGEEEEWEVEDEGGDEEEEEEEFEDHHMTIEQEEEEELEANQFQTNIPHVPSSGLRSPPTIVRRIPKSSPASAAEADASITVSTGSRSLDLFEPTVDEREQGKYLFEPAVSEREQSNYAVQSFAALRGHGHSAFVPVMSAPVMEPIHRHGFHTLNGLGHSIQPTNPFDLISPITANTDPLLPNHHPGISPIRKHHQHQQTYSIVQNAENQTTRSKHFTFDTQHDNILDGSEFQQAFDQELLPQDPPIVQSRNQILENIRQDIEQLTETATNLDIASQRTDAMTTISSIQGTSYSKDPPNDTSTAEELASQYSGQESEHMVSRSQQSEEQSEEQREGQSPHVPVQTPDPVGDAEKIKSEVSDEAASGKSGREAWYPKEDEHPIVVEKESKHELQKLRDALQRILQMEPRIRREMEIDDLLQNDKPTEEALTQVLSDLVEENDPKIEPGDECNKDDPEGVMAAQLSQISTRLKQMRETKGRQDPEEQHTPERGGKRMQEPEGETTISRSKHVLKRPSTPGTRLDEISKKDTNQSVRSANGMGAKDNLSTKETDDSPAISGSPVQQDLRNSPPQQDHHHNMNTERRKEPRDTGRPRSSLSDLFASVGGKKPASAKVRPPPSSGDGASQSRPIVVPDDRRNDSAAIHEPRDLFHKVGGYYTKARYYTPARPDTRDGVEALLDYDAHETYHKHKKYQEEITFVNERDEGIRLIDNRRDDWAEDAEHRADKEYREGLSLTIASFREDDSRNDVRDANYYRRSNGSGQWVGLNARKQERPYRETEENKMSTKVDTEGSEQQSLSFYHVSNRDFSGQTIDTVVGDKSLSLRSTLARGPDTMLQKRIPSIIFASNQEPNDHHSGEGGNPKAEGTTPKHSTRGQDGSEKQDRENVEMEEAVLQLKTKRISSSNYRKIMLGLRRIKIVEPPNGEAQSEDSSIEKSFFKKEHVTSHEFDRVVQALSEAQVVKSPTHDGGDTSSPSNNDVSNVPVVNEKVAKDPRPGTARNPSTDTESDERCRRDPPEIAASETMDTTMGIKGVRAKNDRKVESKSSYEDSSQVPPQALKSQGRGKNKNNLVAHNHDKKKRAYDAGGHKVSRASFSGHRKLGFQRNALDPSQGSLSTSVHTGRRSDGIPRRIQLEPATPTSSPEKPSRMDRARRDRDDPSENGFMVSSSRKSPSSSYLAWRKEISVKEVSLPPPPTPTTKTKHNVVSQIMSIGLGRKEQTLQSRLEPVQHHKVSSREARDPPTKTEIVLPSASPTTVPSSDYAKIGNDPPLRHKESTDPPCLVVRTSSRLHPSDSSVSSPMARKAMAAMDRKKQFASSSASPTGVSSGSSQVWTKNANEASSHVDENEPIATNEEPVHSQTQYEDLQHLRPDIFLPDVTKEQHTKIEEKGQDDLPKTSAEGATPRKGIGKPWNGTIPDRMRFWIRDGKDSAPTASSGNMESKRLQTKRETRQVAKNDNPIEPRPSTPKSKSSITKKAEFELTQITKSLLALQGLHQKAVLETSPNPEDASKEDYIIDTPSWMEKSLSDLSSRVNEIREHEALAAKSFLKDSAGQGVRPSPVEEYISKDEEKSSSPMRPKEVTTATQTSKRPNETPRKIAISKSTRLKQNSTVTKDSRPRDVMDSRSSQGLISQLVSSSIQTESSKVKKRVVSDILPIRQDPPVDYQTRPDNSPKTAKTRRGHDIDDSNTTSTPSEEEQESSSDNQRNTRNGFKSGEEQLERSYGGTMSPEEQPASSDNNANSRAKGIPKHLKSKASLSQLRNIRISRGYREARSQSPSKREPKHQDRQSPKTKTTPIRGNRTKETIQPDNFESHPHKTKALSSSDEQRQQHPRDSPRSSTPKKTSVTENKMESRPKTPLKSKLVSNRRRKTMTYTQASPSSDCSDEEHSTGSDSEESSEEDMSKTKESRNIQRKRSPAPISKPMLRSSENTKKLGATSRGMPEVAKESPNSKEKERGAKPAQAQERKPQMNLRKPSSVSHYTNESTVTGTGTSSAISRSIRHSAPSNTTTAFEEGAEEAIPWSGADGVEIILSSATESYETSVESLADRSLLDSTTESSSEEDEVKEDGERGSRETESSDSHIQSEGGLVGMVLRVRTDEEPLDEDEEPTDTHDDDEAFVSPFDFANFPSDSDKQKGGTGKGQTSGNRRPANASGSNSQMSTPHDKTCSDTTDSVRNLGDLYRQSFQDSPGDQRTRQSPATRRCVAQSNNCQAKVDRFKRKLESASKYSIVGKEIVHNSDKQFRERLNQSKQHGKPVLYPYGDKRKHQQQQDAKRDPDATPRVVKDSKQKPAPEADSNAGETQTEEGHVSRIPSLETTDSSELLGDQYIDGDHTGQDKLHQRIKVVREDIDNLRSRLIQTTGAKSSSAPKSSPKPTSPKISSSKQAPPKLSSSKQASPKLSSSKQASPKPPKQSPSQGKKPSVLHLDMSRKEQPPLLRMPDPDASTNPGLHDSQTDSYSLPTCFEPKRSGSGVRSGTGVLQKAGSNPSNNVSFTGSGDSRHHGDLKKQEMDIVQAAARAEQRVKEGLEKMKRGLADNKRVKLSMEKQRKLQASESPKAQKHGTPTLFGFDLFSWLPK
ncbi:expressed unknown protein [Seminavis robusta]|uniref:Uncharacterized protein n=1 Tax=Seminavis robusta TaxID=568900 RepID=A0A9N8E398_9STRA|nr:expressed unknown protein [Seminavis robusta]|eukprot:Sro511_g157370.1 n/a (3256) ;mRNA; f:2291-12143